MNINQLNKINPINLEKLVGNVTNDGTFKEILEAVLSDKIVPIVNDNGDIIGGSYNMPAKDLIEDNVNKIRFERRYAWKPLLSWVNKALEIKIDPETQVYGVQEVQENGDDIKVVLNNGKVITVSEAYHYSGDSCDEDEVDDEDIDLADLGLGEYSSVREIRKAVKNETGRFLAKDYDVASNLEWNEDTGTYHLTNIKWGRYASSSELD